MLIYYMLRDVKILQETGTKPECQVRNSKSDGFKGGF